MCQQIVMRLRLLTQILQMSRELLYLHQQELSQRLVAAAKLNREQVRASSIENLKSIADDAGIAEDAKKAAVEQLAKLENNADKETAIELLLSAKGFDSSVVTVSDTNVDAVINVSELSDTDKAQIEDIIKRKTGFAADKITINICNN